MKNELNGIISVDGPFPNLIGNHPKQFAGAYIQNPKILARGNKPGQISDRLEKGSAIEICTDFG